MPSASFRSAGIFELDFPGRCAVRPRLAKHAFMRADRIQHAILVHVEAARVAIVGIGADAQGPLPFHFAVEAQALHLRPAPIDHVEGLRLLAHAEALRRALVDVRQGVRPDDLAVGIELEDAVAMLVQPIEVAAGPRLDAGGRIPTDLVVDEEIGHGQGLLKLLVVDRHLVGEMAVGGSDQAAGVGSGVVDGGHRRPAQLVLAVAADAEDVAARHARPT